MRALQAAGIATVRSPADCWAARVAELLETLIRRLPVRYP